jgi:hypothetical protein
MPATFQRNMFEGLCHQYFRRSHNGGKHYDTFPAIEPVEFHCYLFYKCKGTYPVLYVVLMLFYSSSKLVILADTKNAPLVTILASFGNSFSKVISV